MEKNRPALYLEGMSLENGWFVKGRVLKLQEFENKQFAISYIVEKGDKKAILKALDFSNALSSKDPIEAIKELTDKYEFEKSLNELCLDKRLSNIVQIIDSGVVRLSKDAIIPVPYFILEYTDESIEDQIKSDSYLNIAWLLKILHNITKGLFQLHRINVALTKLTPETIRAFSQSLYKLSELGKAEMKGRKSPYQGDPSEIEPIYSTPEELYGYEEKDWKYRYQARDLYSLGNILFYLFTQTTINTWLSIYLNENHKWDKWGGTYEEVLPYLIEAYSKALEQFKVYVEDHELKNSLLNILSTLCHPEPAKRGHPKNTGESKLGPLALEKYLSEIDALYNKAIIRLKVKK